MSTCVPSAPLSRGWPAHVTSAYLHAVSLARAVLIDVCSGFENSPLVRAHEAARLARLECVNARLTEENRILRARVACIPPRERPRYPPAERLAILGHRSAHGLSTAETARTFLVTPKTIKDWMRRRDEQGDDALVRLPEPVNRFPDFVAAIVQALKAALPSMGRKRIAQTLARAGLHLAPSTARRHLERPVRPTPATPTSEPNRPECEKSSATSPPPRRRVTAKYPQHLWHIDLTVVPTWCGFWLSFFPFSFSVGWPFCWWVAAVLDHYSRAVVGHAVFASQPSAVELCAVLDSAVKRAGRAPRHIVSDQGPQFGNEYRAWCTRFGAKPRFGAIGKHGSIAIIERFFRSFKDEAMHKILVPFSLSAMQSQIALFVRWYERARPHQSLAGRTPLETLRGGRPAHLRPRLEPRARYPANATCAAPRVPVRGKCGVKLDLVISHPPGAPHLPEISLRRAA